MTVYDLALLTRAMYTGTLPRPESSPWGTKPNVGYGYTQIGSMPGCWGVVVRNWDGYHHRAYVALFNSRGGNENNILTALTNDLGLMG